MRLFVRDRRGALLRYGDGGVLETSVARDSERERRDKNRLPTNWGSTGGGANNVRDLYFTAWGRGAGMSGRPRRWRGRIGDVG